MERNHQFRQILWLSFGLHLLLVAGGVVILALPSQITITSLAEEAQEKAQMVELCDPSELPENLSVPEEQKPEPMHPEQKLLAFRSLSTLPGKPTPAPTPTMIPTPIPTLTPMPVPTPTPRRFPTPLPTLTPTPERRATPTPQPVLRASTKKTGFDVPKRQGVLQPTPFAVRRSPAPTAKTPEHRRQLFLGTQGKASSGPSVTLDQEDAFPFPAYLLHIEKKIAGLWYPNGSGMVSIYLIIARNGKILQSEVDKGEGFGVEKLQESIQRTLTLITHFEPLPQEYAGRELRVRIVVRR